MPIDLYKSNCNPSWQDYFSSQLGDRAEKPGVDAPYQTPPADPFQTPSPQVKPSAGVYTPECHAPVATWAAFMGLVDHDEIEIIPGLT